MLFRIVDAEQDETGYAVKVQYDGGEEWFGFSWEDGLHEELPSGERGFISHIKSELARKEAALQQSDTHEYVDVPSLVNSIKDDEFDSDDRPVGEVVDRVESRVVKVLNEAPRIVELDDGWQYFYHMCTVCQGQGDRVGMKRIRLDHTNAYVCSDCESKGEDPVPTRYPLDLMNRFGVESALEELRAEGLDV